MLNFIIQCITPSCSEEIELIVLCVLEDQYFLDFIYFNNTVNFFLAIVTVGIEVRSKFYAIEKDVKNHRLLLSKLRLTLEERFKKRPKYHLVDETV